MLTSLFFQRANILKGTSHYRWGTWVTKLWHFSLEVQIMRGINHPCIVKLLDFFESDEYYFLVLERAYIATYILLFTQ